MTTHEAESLLLLFPGSSDSEQEEEETATAEAETEQHHHHPQQRQYQLRSIESQLVIRQLPSQGLSFQLWPAASTLLSLFDDYRLDPAHSPLLPILPACRPLRVLEIGSGTGLAGIAAATVLGAHVTLTDLPHVVPNLHFNAQSNAAAVSAGGGRLGVRPLRWGSREDVEELEAEGMEFDLVVASDVVYHDHLFQPLLDTLAWLLPPAGGFLMAHLRRWKKDSVFFGKARKLFRIAAIHTDPPLPGARTGVAVYHFTKKS